MNGSTFFFRHTLSHSGCWGNKGCARHGFREDIMGVTCVKLDVVQLPLEETTSFEGNATINSLKRLLEELFEFAPYVRIIGEDKIYHHSEFNDLERHINELNTAMK